MLSGPCLVLTLLGTVHSFDTKRSAMPVWIQDILWLALPFVWMPIYLLYLWLFDPADGKFSNDLPDDWYPDHYN